MTVNPFPLERQALLQCYRTMRTIREFEERLHADFAKGDIPGFVHLYAGEEAAGTGIMMHLEDKDRIASTHRGHGHCIAKGVDPKEMMAEIYGKVSRISADAATDVTIDEDEIRVPVMEEEIVTSRTGGRRR